MRTTTTPGRTGRGNYSHTTQSPSPCRMKRQAGCDLGTGAIPWRQGPCDGTPRGRTAATLFRASLDGETMER